MASLHLGLYKKTLALIGLLKLCTFNIFAGGVLRQGWCLDLIMEDHID